MIHLGGPRLRRFLMTAVLMLFGSRVVTAAETSELIAAIKRVGQEGRGNREALAAVAELQKQGPEELPEIFKSFRGANPLAANYLLGAVETIIDRARETGQNLPLQEIAAFVNDRQEHPRARRVAFELLPAGQRQNMLADMLDDPSSELRRQAVAAAIESGKTLLEDGNRDAATARLQQALKGATDKDQVDELVKRLGELGVNVDVATHFGFLTAWSVVGPFDNREKIGFSAVYPPEEGVDLDESYAGKTGRVTWAPYTTDDKYGVFDVAKQIENYKGSVMYAVTDFYSDRERDAEIRIGTPNAWKLWVNGEFQFGREEYHRGMKLDQYRVPVKLQAGKNTILLKICQNEQTQDWAQRYRFQLRVCDPSGVAILSSPAETPAQDGGN